MFKFYRDQAFLKPVVSSGRTSLKCSCLLPSFTQLPLQCVRQSIDRVVTFPIFVEQHFEVFAPLAPIIRDGDVVCGQPEVASKCTSFPKSLGYRRFKKLPIKFWSYQLERNTEFLCFRLIHLQFFIRFTAFGSGIRSPQTTHNVFCKLIRKISEHAAAGKFNFKFNSYLSHGGGSAGGRLLASKTQLNDDRTNRVEGNSDSRGRCYDCRERPERSAVDFEPNSTFYYRHQSRKHDNARDQSDRSAEPDQHVVIPSLHHVKRNASLRAGT